MHLRVGRCEGTIATLAFWDGVPQAATMTSSSYKTRQFWPLGGRRTFETLATKAPPVACARFTKFPALIVRTLSISSLSGRHDAHALLKSVGGGAYASSWRVAFCGCAAVASATQNAHR